MTIGRLVLIGAGGHARVVLDAARLAGWTIDGLVDRDGSGREVDGARVLGDDNALAMVRERGATHAVVAVGSVRPGALRADLFARLVSAGLEPAVIIHPSATIAASASVGPGSVVLAGAIINPGAVIGRNVIINTGAVVEHDCVVGDAVHLSPRSVLGGNVTVEAGAHVGIGAVVIQGLTIGAGALVAAGATVVDDVAPGITVLGVPARPRATA